MERDGGIATGVSGMNIDRLYCEISLRSDVGVITTEPIAPDEAILREVPGELVRMQNMTGDRIRILWLLKSAPKMKQALLEIQRLTRVSRKPGDGNPVGWKELREIQRLVAEALAEANGEEIRKAS
jgi:hypothetical protein